MLGNYLAAALGNLLRNRTYSAINLFGLTVGFAAAVIIALYVHDELSYDHFFRSYRDVYLLTSTEDMTDRRNLSERWDFSFPDVAAKLRTEFSQMAAIARLMTPESPPRIRKSQAELEEAGFLWVDPSFFEVMPPKSVAGDPQTALAAPDSLVLTRSAARKYFGRDDPVGELLEVNPAMGPEPAQVSGAFDTPHPMRVTAVIEDLPPNSTIKGAVFGSSRAAYSPFTLYDLTAPQGPFRQRAYTFIRLRPGSDAQRTQQQLAAFAHRESQVYPPGFTVGLLLTPIAQVHLSPAAAGPLSPRGDRTLLAALATITVLIIGSASINFAALMTARASQRAIETGVRKAAGSLRSQVMVQFLGEAVIYAALAMVLAVALAAALLPQVNAVLGLNITLNPGDPALWGALALAAAVLGVLAGAYPAFVLSAFRPAAVLKGGPVQGASGGRLRRALVAAQFAIMIGLGITAATIWRQTLFSLNNQLRVDGSRILLIDDACTPSGRAFQERIRTLPGVAAAACATDAALFNGGMIVSAQVQGRTATSMVSGSVDYGALEFYGIRPLAGRFFDRSHGDDGRLVQGDETGNPSIVINEAALHKLGFSSPSQALGQVVTWNRRRWSASPNSGTLGASQIIGVLPDITLDTRKPSWPQILYVDPKSLDTLSVRLRGSDIPQALTAIDAAWSQMMPASIHRRFFSQSLQETYAGILLQGKAISLGAGLAVLIAALGLLGFAIFTAERRTKEIGLRKVMGATRLDILRFLGGQFIRPVLWANLLAWPCAYLVMQRWLEGFTVHVQLGLLTFLGSAVLAIVIAGATVAAHALKVTRARPVAALRYE